MHPELTIKPPYLTMDQRRHAALLFIRELSKQSQNRATLLSVVYCHAESFINFGPLSFPNEVYEKYIALVNIVTPLLGDGSRSPVASDLASMLENYPVKSDIGGVTQEEPPAPF